MVIASEAELLRTAARERPGQPGLWLQPGVIDLGDSDCLEVPGLRLHAAGDGFSGDIRCGAVLPLASESCGVVVVQHLADISAEPAALLAECARVLVPGGRLWLLALNPLAPYRLRWRGQGPRAAEPVTWRRRLRAAGLAPDPVSPGHRPDLGDVDQRPPAGWRRPARGLPVACGETPDSDDAHARTRKLRLQPGLPAA